MAQATNPKKDKKSNKSAKAAANPANNPVANPNEGGNKFFMLAIGAILVLGIAGLALVVTNREVTDLDGPQTAAVEIESDAVPLPPTPGQVSVDPSADPVIGTQLPVVSGTDFTDTPITIENDGRAKAVYFLAHWCPHCQEEVPNVVELVEDGRKPDNLDIYAISTSVDASRGNFPPVRWLDIENFTFPVIRDSDASEAFALMGGEGFPYTIYVDADNNVVARSSGTLGPDAIAELWGLAAAGGAGTE